MVRGVESTPLTATNGDASSRRSDRRWVVSLLTVGAGLALLGYQASREGAAVYQDSAEGLNSQGTRSLAEFTQQRPTGCGPISVWQSSYAYNKTRMMQQLPSLLFSRKPAKPASVISVDSSKKYQEIFGFGGGFTEASGRNFVKLPKNKQQEVLQLYFDKEKGSGYTYGRVPMGSTDFSVYSYTHLNVSGDVELKFFDDNLTEDSQHIIPLVQGALSKNPDMKFMLSPWSPPSWMKAADPARNYTPSMLGSAIPNGLIPEYRLPWAKYFSRFMSAYKKRGIKFWGLTPQNEPEFAAPWEACRSTPEFQADFIGDFLGPVIARDHPGTKIMVYDHNRVSAPHWAQVLYSHPKASKYVHGLASHWYNNNDRYMDGIEFHERNNDTHYVDESRFMLSTESSITPGVAKGDEAWARAQRYAHNIITELDNWVNGWLDWNLIVNHYGGPNHLSYYYDAGIVVNEDEKDYTIQPIYYFIQHISKYALPGSHRIDAQVAVRFKKPGQTGLNVHFPAALHNCDGSSRQSFSLADSKLQVKGSEFCLDVVPRLDVGEDQLEIVKCANATNKWATSANGAIRTGDVCLQLYKGSHQDGARVTIAECLDKLPGYQTWAVKNELITSADAPEKCVTAGYSFVQSVAFLTPANKKVLVVLNENTEDADFELQYQGSSVATTIPAGAIRTYQWE